MDDTRPEGTLEGPASLDEFMREICAILSDERAAFLQRVSRRLEGVELSAELRQQFQSRRLMRHLILERIVHDLESLGYGLNTSLATDLQILLTEKLGAE